ncbi:ATP-dependent RNA helicase [Chitinispirillum alkaliphilum]|nr:ATP-dependent RNA helicase [Chitinispirillum alkaliphilum]
MIEQSLKNLNIAALNEMQTQAIDAIYTNRNTLIHAPTGSGKTLAYLLPTAKMINQTISAVQALIIVPSRELACQIQDVHKATRSPVKIMCCYGGHSLEAEKNSFRNSPPILVGTPGRIVAHIEANRFDYSKITTLVLDEFDKSLEFGFLEEMEFIVGNLKKLKKRICISATRLKEIPEFVGMKEPFRVEFSDEDLQPRITLKTVESPDPDKLETLLHLVKYIGNQSAVVFCNHRDAVDRVTRFLQSKDIDVVKYHGGMEQEDREESLLKFRNGSYHLLVTTDLASRGLNIPEIKFIIHYHLPTTETSFIHRNGRTARMNATGTTYIILSEADKLPSYLPKRPQTEVFSRDLPLPDKTEWVTVKLNLGKRDKINKVDIVGFLFRKGRLAKDELGLVEVTHRESFAAVKRVKADTMLRHVANETVKRKKVNVTVV